jgi:GNAT superfamily N-acetyltransferase
MDDESEPCGFSIRELGARELRDGYGTVTRLWTEAGLAFRASGRDAADRLATQLAGGRAFLLLAEERERWIGVLLGSHDGRKGWINRLAVSPAYRRRGVAARLVRDAERRLYADGIEVIAALIESPNRISLAFFQSIGYVHDPEIEYVSTRRSPEA